MNLEILSHVIHVSDFSCVTCCHLSCAVDIKTLELTTIADVVIAGVILSHIN